MDVFVQPAFQNASVVRQKNLCFDTDHFLPILAQMQEDF